MSSKIIQNVSLASQLLKNGDLVAFPTETVYGLGADATNPIAIQKVFKAKGRPENHPLIVHIASSQQLSDWAINIPSGAGILAAAFWPGALTMVLNKHPQVSSFITGGQDTVAIRIPNHPLTLNLLREFGSGIVGPSANKYGHVSPTTAEHVAADLNNEVSAILDGGACEVGIESTIVHVTDNTVTIMRQGMITAEQLSAALGYPVQLAPSLDNQVRVSGSHTAHYAPNTALRIMPFDVLISEAENFSANKSISIVSFRAQPESLLSEKINWQKVSDNPEEFAHNLYAMLRDLDQQNLDLILIEQPPQTINWAAINDRLGRASAKN